MSIVGSSGLRKTANMVEECALLINCQPSLASFDLGCVLPHGAEHGCEGEEGGHGHARPAGDGLGRQEQRQPGHDHEQAWAGTPVNTHTRPWWRGYNPT